MHTRKEVEVHYVEKGRFSCDSDVPQVGSARTDSTRVVKVNRHKMSHHKMRPYCIYILQNSFSLLYDRVLQQYKMSL